MVRGKFDFSERVGTYSANDGKAGDLVVLSPAVGQVYAYGQNDYRNDSNTVIRWAKWNGNEFVSCDKLGREI